MTAVTLLHLQTLPRSDLQQIHPETLKLALKEVRDPFLMKLALEKAGFDEKIADETVEILLMFERLESFGSDNPEDSDLSKTLNRIFEVYMFEGFPENTPHRLALATLVDLGCFTAMADRAWTGLPVKYYTDLLAFYKTKDPYIELKHPKKLVQFFKGATDFKRALVDGGLQTA